MQSHCPSVLPRLAIRYHDLPLIWKFSFIYELIVQRLKECYHINKAVKNICVLLTG